MLRDHRFCLSLATVTVVLQGLFATQVRAVPMEEEGAKVETGEEVITMYPTSLKDGDTVLAQLEAGTRLHVTDVNGPWVATALEQNGKTISGWVHRKHLRTPAMLTSLRGLGKEFENYRLSEEPLPKNVNEAALIIRGAPVFPKFITQNGEVFVAVGDRLVRTKGVSGVTIHLHQEPLPSEKKGVVGDIFTQYLRASLVDRNLLTRVSDDSDWQLVIKCNESAVSIDNDTVSAYCYGELYFVNTKTKVLAFQKVFAGAGNDQQGMVKDFANQVAVEYATIMGLDR